MVNKPTRYQDMTATLLYLVPTIALLLLYLIWEVNWPIIAQFLLGFFFFSLIYFVREKNPVQIDIIFLVFLNLYIFSVPISHIINGGGEYADFQIKKATVICWISLIGYAVGLAFADLFGIRSHRRNIDISHEATDYHKVRKIGYCIFFIGIVSSFLAILMTVGIEVYLNAGYAGRALLKREAGPIELGLYVSVIGMVFVYASCLISDGSSKRDLLFIFLATACFIAYVSFLGVRRPSFLLIVSYACVYFLVVNRIGFFKIILSGFSLIFLFSTFANYRQVISSDGVYGAFVYIKENISWEWLDFSKTELGAPFSTLLDIIDSPLADRLYLGRSYLETFIYILPGTLNDGVKSLSVIYTEGYFTHEFISIGGNMGFFPVTEAYVNFGILGVPIVFAIFAFFLSALNFMSYSSSGSKIFQVIFFSILVPWLAFFMRLDFASAVKGFIYSQFFPLLFGYFLCRTSISISGRRLL